MEEIQENLQAVAPEENETVQPVEESKEKETEVIQAAPEDNPQLKNMREMRIRKERAEKERDDAYKLIQQFKDQQTAKSAEPEENLDFSVADDDLVEGRHLGKVDKRIKQLEEKLKKYQQTSTAATVEVKLRNKYSDFDKVVSKANVEALVRDYPELGDTLRSSSDLYSQAVTAYTMIKQMGVYKEDKFSQDRARAEVNAGKPRPLTSMSPQQGDGPLSKANAFANGLTDELKESLLKEMNDARSRM